MGHNNKDCKKFKDEIEFLIRRGKMEGIRKMEIEVTTTKTEIEIKEMTTRVETHSLEGMLST